eukprot:4860721-Alexandrium_andersonii.AAC.1
MTDHAKITDCRRIRTPEELQQARGQDAAVQRIALRALRFGASALRCSSDLRFSVSAFRRFTVCASA